MNTSRGMRRIMRSFAATVAVSCLERRIRNDPDRAARRRGDIDVKRNRARGRIGVFADRWRYTSAPRGSAVAAGSLALTSSLAFLLNMPPMEANILPTSPSKFFLGNIHAEHGDERQKQNDQPPEEDGRTLAASYAAYRRRILLRRTRRRIRRSRRPALRWRASLPPALCGLDWACNRLRPRLRTLRRRLHSRPSAAGRSALLQAAERIWRRDAGRRRPTRVPLSMRWPQ